MRSASPTVGWPESSGWPPICNALGIVAVDGRDQPTRCHLSPGHDDALGGHRGPIVHDSGLWGVGTFTTTTGELRP